jgi:SP family general alpha glucoside:H+ symporter-like MFS transporter
MWFPPLIIGIFLAPESPWWLVRKERYEDAKRSLLRLASPKTDVDMMRHTNELEKDLTEGVSYLDCFKGVNLRRTEIVCMLFVSQNFAGNTFSNYSTYFFEQAGLTGDVPYDFALGQYGLNTIGAFVVWTFMAWGVGRRTLFLVGLTGLFFTLLALGVLV